MSDWQKIETAPKDTAIMLGSWFVDELKGYWGGDHWFWQASGCIEDDGVWIDHEDAYVDATNFHMPTHWKPLDPAPPTE